MIVLLVMDKKNKEPIIAAWTKARHKELITVL